MVAPDLVVMAHVQPMGRRALAADAGVQMHGAAAQARRLGFGPRHQAVAETAPAPLGQGGDVDDVQRLAQPQRVLDAVAEHGGSRGRVVGEDAGQLVAVGPQLLVDHPRHLLRRVVRPEFAQGVDRAGGVVCRDRHDRDVQGDLLFGLRSVVQAGLPLCCVG